MARAKLTDMALRAAIRRAKPGVRTDLPGDVPGLVVRVGTRQATFCLYKRRPGSKSPVRIKLGTYNPEHPDADKDDSEFLTLDGARQRALRWDGFIKAGKEPSREDRRQQPAKAEETPHTFAEAVERYIREQVIGIDPEHPNQRQGNNVAQGLRAEFVNDRKIEREGRGGKEEIVTRAGLGTKLITDVTVDNVMQVIRDARYRSEKRWNAQDVRHRTETPSADHARNLYYMIKSFFDWAGPIYSLKRLPIEGIKPAKHIGKKRARDRVLSSDEIRALWWAAARLPAPYTAFYRLSILTMQRVSDYTEAPVSEFDLDGALWRIDVKRMKLTRSPPKGPHHEVPLSDLALRVIETVWPKQDRRAGQPFLFSTTDGETEIGNLGRIKSELDDHMLDVLQDIAAENGKDPDDAELIPWKNMDTRRTARTCTAELEVAEDVLVSEQVLEAIQAHAKKDVQRHYNHASFLKAKRVALDLWAAKVAEIVSKEPNRRAGNVTNLSAARRKAA